VSPHTHTANNPRVAHRLRRLPLFTHVKWAPVYTVLPRFGSHADGNGHGHPEMSVILLDDVDVTFHSHGDNGFWLAAKQLAKKSKCPIVMTCTTIPPDLKNLRSLLHFTKRSNTIECMLRVAAVLTVLDKQHLVSVASLQLICSTLKNDLRRIFNELQAFACNPSSRGAVEGERATEEDARPTAWQQVSATQMPHAGGRRCEQRGRCL